MTVNWAKYAIDYDLMAEINPSYQELLNFFRQAISTWDIEPNDITADFGAGTGNFSLILANAFPCSTVMHIDSNSGMNTVAAAKAVAGKIRNLSIVQSDLLALDLPDNSLAGAVCVHTLYATPKPNDLIQKIHDLLQPGGYVFFCDLGRPLQIPDWRRYLISSSIQTRGILRTLLYAIRCRNIAQENRRIALQQMDGTFWTHDHQTFIKTLEDTGFTVLEHFEAYRAYSDVAVCKKPE